MGRKLDPSKDTLDFLSALLEPKRYRQVVAKMMGLLLDPEPPDSSLLKGHPDLRRADIGEYRIVYRYDEDTLFIVLIGKRNDDEIYRQLKNR